MSPTQTLSGASPFRKPPQPAPPSRLQPLTTPSLPMTPRPESTIWHPLVPLLRWPSLRLAEQRKPVLARLPSGSYWIAAGLVVGLGISLFTEAQVAHLEPICQQPAPSEAIAVCLRNLRNAAEGGQIIARVLSLPLLLVGGVTWWRGRQKRAASVTRESVPSLSLSEMAAEESSASGLL